MENYNGLDFFVNPFLNKIDWYIRKRLTLIWNKKRNRRNKHNQAQGLIAGETTTLITIRVFQALIEAVFPFFGHTASYKILI